MRTGLVIWQERAVHMARYYKTEQEHKEALKAKIIDIVQSVDEIWLLSLILRSIKCVTEKGEAV